MVVSYFIGKIWAIEQCKVLINSTYNDGHPVVRDDGHGDEVGDERDLIGEVEERGQAHQTHHQQLA